MITQASDRDTVTAAFVAIALGLLAIACGATQLGYLDVADVGLITVIFAVFGSTARENR